MKQQDYNAVISVKATPKQVFHAFNSVSKWWTENLDGSSNHLNDIFTVHFGDTFVTHKIIEFVPDKKVVWQVTDCNLHWLKDKKEWQDTTMSCEISPEKDGSKLSFTHIGIYPGVECFEACSLGWNEYIKGSLVKLISEGKGKPEKKKAEQVL